MAELLILPELKDLLPRLEPNEFAALRQSIAEEGVRESLIIWVDDSGDQILVDGHHRHEIATGLGVPYRIRKKKFKSLDDVRLWMIRHARSRRNLSKFDQVLLALQEEAHLRKLAKDNQRTKSRGKVSRGHETVHVDKIVAEKAGVSSQTVHRVRYLLKECPDEMLHQIRRGDSSINRAYLDQRKENRRRSHEARIAGQLATLKGQPLADDLNIHHGRFQDLMATLENDSVSLIYTDPPYGLESVPLFGDLAKLAARVLKPGGCLAVMSGQAHIPEILAQITPYLRYLWQVAVIHEHHQTGDGRIHTSIGFKNLWKPVWLFTKGSRMNRRKYLRDVIVSRKSKEGHEWGQGFPEATQIIEAFSEPGDLVIDPMVGGGNFLAAAAGMQRRWWGCDTDERSVLMTRDRISKIEDYGG